LTTERDDAAVVAAAERQQWWRRRAVAHGGRVLPRPVDLGLAMIVLAALLLRIDLANIRPYLHDEANTSIPLARSISFSPGALNLPLHGENHGALPAYIVNGSRELFGASRLGNRLLHVLLSVVTIVLVALVARQWYGLVAARWAAALLAFNEFFFFVSARSTAHVPYLLCVVLAVYGLSRFLAHQRPAHLYVVAVSLGLAFYSKEHAALLMPLAALTLVRPAYRGWLRTRHPYLAGALFLALLVPDIVWNVRAEREPTVTSYGAQPANYATYASHLERIGGLGLSPYPLMFYARSVVQTSHRALFGTELRDETPEYASLNPVLGLVLFASVVAATLRRPRDEVQLSLLPLFWGVFLFFTLIEPGDPPGRLDPVSWIWVESTLVPAVILTAGGLARVGGRWRLLAWGVVAIALAYGGWAVYR
jgi:4-amino-4-deoxy-L-arabinose transferase-like glycosyltransferase